MKRRLFILASLLMAATTGFAKVEKTINLTVNGVARSFLVYVPDGATKSSPLVISLHGAAGHSADKSPMGTDVADNNKCIIAYPQGLDQYFPIFGGSTPGWNSTGEANEELDFFKAIIKSVNDQYGIDTKRVYCCGFSNGGMMTYANANSASDIFAAFASISGFPLNEFHHRHTGVRPVPFLHIHGKADDFVKYSCMPIIRDNMVSRNGCNPVPEVTEVSGKYRKSVYAAANGGFPYVYYEVDGMGHQPWCNGTEDGNSSVTMWKFMSQYTLDSKCDRQLKWCLNIDAEGFEPAQHNWRVNGDKTRFTFGTEKLANNEDNNVYPTLQFVKGDYQLRFATTGKAGNNVIVKIATMDGKQIVCKKVEIGKTACIPFSITELTNTTYSECRMTIQKDAASDKFTSLAIYESTEVQEGSVEGTDCDMPAEKPVAETGYFIEVEQNQNADYDDFVRTELVKGSEYNTYTSKGDLQIAFKMEDIDITDCDYVVIRFAEPVGRGWHLAFWADTKLVAIPAGSTEYKFVFEQSMIDEGLLPQLCMMTYFGSPAPLEAKVSGIYLHCTKASPVATIKTDARPIAFYSLQGVKKKSLSHGINIVLLSDGTTKKMVVK